ncbi:MAG: energy transducer TonB [Candidatus Omnitrophica bacterium]|nr:energy transducer TonB [Candidatus Omnitrophota bacterium]
MTPQFRWAMGCSIGLHVLALTGMPWLAKPPAFDVERAPTSMELYFVAPPPPAPVDSAPQITEPLPELVPQTIISEARRGAEADVLPDYLRNPPPVYPRTAREQGYEGTVVLEVEVLASGRCGAMNILSSSGYRMLDDAAVSAVRRWVFRPARRWREPVPFWVEIPITFRLMDAQGGFDG